MKMRVGILTSGGDCPGLNATIRGVAKALYQRMGDKVEIIGILNGYDGLINGNYRVMAPDEFSGILTVGGTILGTKRTPFKMMRVVGDDKVDKVAAMKKTYKDAKLDCLLSACPKRSTMIFLAPMLLSVSIPLWTLPLTLLTASTPLRAATAA